MILRLLGEGQRAIAVVAAANARLRVVVSWFDGGGSCTDCFNFDGEGSCMVLLQFNYLVFFSLSQNGRAFILWVPGSAWRVP